jgi:hypothetical protein
MRQVGGFHLCQLAVDRLIGRMQAPGRCQRDREVHPADRQARPSVASRKSPTQRRTSAKDQHGRQQIHAETHRRYAATRGPHQPSHSSQSEIGRQARHHDQQRQRAPALRHHGALVEQLQRLHRYGRRAQHRSGYSQAQRPPRQRIPHHANQHPRQGLQNDQRSQRAGGKYQQPQQEGIGRTAIRLAPAPRGGMQIGFGVAEKESQVRIGGQQQGFQQQYQ